MSDVTVSDNSVVKDKKIPVKVILLLVLVIGMVVNLAVLDYDSLFVKEEAASTNEATILESRIKLLEEAIEESKKSEQSEELAVGLPAASVTMSPTPKPDIKTTTYASKPGLVSTTNQVKEYYIPLGSATLSTENFNWEDTGAEAKFDPDYYGKIKSISFEATLSVPSGQIEARLYNVSDGYEIGSSRLVGDGSKPRLYNSGNLNLVKGLKTYRVQIRTSLNYQGSMENARLHIVIE